MSYVATTNFKEVKQPLPATSIAAEARKHRGYCNWMSIEYDVNLLEHGTEVPSNHVGHIFGVLVCLS